MDFEYLLDVTPALLGKLPLVLGVVVSSAVGGFTLAVLVTALRLRRVPLLHPLLEGYVSFMRCTPGIIHILLVYYGLPVLLGAFGIHIDALSKVAFAVITLVLSAGAVMSEVMRPALLAVSPEQREAALSVGMTRTQTALRVTAPQALPVALPNLGNAVIALLDDTSLLFLIGVIDLMGLAEVLISDSYGIHKLEVYVAIALIYWACTIAISALIRRAEASIAEYVK